MCVILGITCLSIGTYIPMVFLGNPILFCIKDTLPIEWDCKIAGLVIHLTAGIAILVMLPANTALIIRLHRERKLQRSFLFQNMANEEDGNLGCACILLQSFDIRMTIALIGISFCYIVLSMPRIWISLTNDNLISQGLLSTFAYHTFHLNFACNFIFYFLLASDCRKELKRFFLKCLKR